MNGAPPAEVADLGDPPERLTVTVEQVRRLVAAQLPQWAGLPVRPVARGGWDNLTFHLGSELVVRLPSAAAYAEAVAKEQRWLPVLAAALPVPVPAPLALGRPGEDYPFPWSVYGWIEGETASPDRVVDPVGLGLDLADFLAALHGVDPRGGPRPGLHNWYRGGSLRTYEASTRRALDALDGALDVGPARRAWAAALATGWDGVEHWFHGDVASGNLLLRGGRLGAVIDFGTCGVGDPACDLAVAWTLLTPAARDAFRHRLGVDEAAWERGRGWALWKALVTCAATYDDPAQLDAHVEARRVLDAVTAEPSGR